jgi:AcrR family transcriptional regulator
VPRGKRLGRPVGSIGEDTRLRIISIAMKHIGEHGYAKATLNKIADDGGLTSGAVYYYFPSKKALVVAVLADVTAKLLGRFERAASKAGSLQGKLIAILEETIAITDEMPDLARFSVSVRVDGSRYPELRSALANSSKKYFRLYRQLVEEGIEAGDVAPGIDPQDVTDMFSMINFGLTMLTVEMPGDRHRVAIRTIEMLLAGTLFPRTIEAENGHPAAGDSPARTATADGRRSIAN